MLAGSKPTKHIIGQKAINFSNKIELCRGSVAMGVFYVINAISYSVQQQLSDDGRFLRSAEAPERETTGGLSDNSTTGCVLRAGRPASRCIIYCRFMDFKTMKT